MTSNVQPLSPVLPPTSIMTLNNIAQSASVLQTNEVVLSTISGIAQNQYSGTTRLPSQVIETMISQQSYNTSKLSEQEKISRGLIGPAGVSFKQLSVPGQCMKPGSGEFVEQLISTNPNLPISANASKILYSGQNGINNTQELNNNITAQTSALSNSLQTANTALINDGLISGKEQPTQIAGIVMATSIVGIAAMKECISSNGSNMSASIKEAIASGNFAAGLSDKLKSGLQGLSTSLTEIKDKIKDKFGLNVSTAELSTSQQAFLVSEKSYGELKANIPNVLGGGESSGINDQITGVVKTVFDYGISKEELAFAEKKLLQAESNYNYEPSEANLAAIREAEEKVTKVKQKLAQMEAAAISESKSATSSITSMLDSNISDAVATTATSGLNALPGGIGAVANNTVSSVTDGINLKSIIDSSSGSNLSEKISSSLKNAKLKLEDATKSIKNSATSILSRIKTSLSSIGNQSGQIKPATLASDTFSETKDVVNGVIGSTLDPRVPLPVFTEMISSTPPELQIVIKTAAQKALEELKAKREEKALALDSLIVENTADPTSDNTKEIEKIRTELSVIDANIAFNQRLLVKSST